VGGETAGSNPHGRIVRALIVGVLFIGVAKIAGLAKELAMAWRFGSGPVADAYALTFSLASWPAAVWVSVATVLIVPLMVAARREDPETLDLLRRELVAAALVLGAGLGLVVFIGLNLGLTQGWFLASERAAEARRMVGPLALTVPLAAVSAVLAAWLISAQRQINTLFEGAPSLLLFGVLAAMPMADGAVARGPRLPASSCTCFC
jgi:putative peptidoglycan lipid II flippase